MRLATRMIFAALALVALALAEGRAAVQGVKNPAGATEDKPAVRYQVDVRVQVSPEADKKLVVLWFQLLKDVGADGVSEMPGVPSPPKAGEKADPAIQSAGPRRVLAQGAIGPSGNLHFGTESFRYADRGRLQAFFKKLHAEGVPGPDPASPLWGLSKIQFDLLQAELKQPSQFDLKDQPLEKFLAELRGRTKLAIKTTPDIQQRTGATRLTGTTGELSRGAALAFVLGQHGLAWEPRQGDAGGVTVLVMSREDSKRPWPVGIAPEIFTADVAPVLMTNTRYKTDNTPLAEVLTVFRRELKMDVLLDAASLAERDFDADKLRSTVLITGGTFTSAIRKTLAPMSLKHELRIDEANRPFLWVTYGEPTGMAPKKKL